MFVSVLAAVRALLAALALLTPATAAAAPPGAAPNPGTASTSTAPRTGTASTTGTARPAAGAAVRGKATHYGPAATGGNCSYPTVPANKLTVAAGPDLYAASGGCGGYLQVTAGKKTITVKIDNQCPECKPGHLDLTDEAFARLAPLGKGVVPISYRIVTDPKVSGGLAFVVKSGSSRYWLGLLVDNTGNRVRSLEVQVGGRYRKLARTDYNYWLAPDGAGPGPFTVRVTDVTGHRAVATGIRLSPGAVQKTAARLYR